VSQDRTQKARELMTAALSMDHAERAQFLERETEGDGDLLEQTMLLIEEAEEETTQILDQGRRGQLQFGEAYLAGRRQIGNYRLLRRIGQGGMGVVYAACLVTEDFQKQVALKLVKPSLASSQILRRFRMERQMLAALDHPNIARLLDAGTSEEGAPYLVMEFVEGLPIDRYSETKTLSISERIRLFLTVCDAVQYAHQNLIIHRDIKPSNILVSAEGVPKLLDFGIAKLVRPEEEDADLRLTATDSRPMSPHYASPEQARGEAITTASDVYSLGVLLYELLTGRLPYEFKTRTAAGIEKTICEEIPALPSAVAYPDTIPDGAEKTRRRLRGDLDMILMMALRKEPQRRYSSVQQFADDLRRHLDGLPVSAQKDTFGYRFHKFVNRHRGGVIAASLAVTALLTATVVSVHFAQVATQEKKVAEQRFEDTRQLALFFITDFDSKIRTSQTEARRALAAKAVEYLRRLSSEVQGDATLLREVVNGYLRTGDLLGNIFSANLGDRAGALESFREALRLAETRPDLLEREILQARMRIADIDALRNGRAALRAYEEILPKLKGADEAFLRNRMGFVLAQLDDHRRAFDEYSRSVEILRGEIEKSPPGTLDVQAGYAWALQGVGTLLAARKDAESRRGAIEPLTDACGIYESLGLRSSKLKCSVILADALGNARRFDGAEAQHRENVETAETLVRGDPTNLQTRRDYVAALSRLAAFLAARGKLPGEQRALTAKALQEVRPLVERPDPATYDLQLATWILLNTPFAEQRRPADALRYAERWMEQSGTGNPQALDAAAGAYFQLGDREKAIRYEKKALALIVDVADESGLRAEFERNLRRFQSAPLAK
jgi:serine/threonine protein kinase/tetratricopeptide (TPR) repeat protein